MVGILSVGNGNLLVLWRDWQTFSIKSQTVNILGLPGPRICIATTQLCHRSTKVTIDNLQTNEHGCVLTKLYIQIDSIIEISYNFLMS